MNTAVAWYRSILCARLRFCLWSEAANTLRGVVRSLCVFLSGKRSHVFCSTSWLPTAVSNPASTDYAMVRECQRSVVDICHTSIAMRFNSTGSAFSVVAALNPAVLAGGVFVFRSSG